MTGSFDDHEGQAEPRDPVKPRHRHLPLARFEAFLPPANADALLAFAVANEARFAPARVTRARTPEVDEASRRAFDFAGDADEWSQPVAAAIRARFAELCAALGMAEFTIAELELTLSAHRDGCFFAPHVDIATGARRNIAPTDRVISTVLYLNRTPPQFAGGTLDLMSLDGGARRSIAPQHNLLVAFPSFAPHCVGPVAVPGDHFGDARFSVNCWIRRARR